MVSGSRMTKAVPTPARVATPTVPRRSRTFSRTTSSPTPRPDISLTVRVLNPGAKIRSESWRSSMASTSRDGA